MPTNVDAQGLLFQKIRELLPPHTSLVDEIADILNISTDGVYRRLRGETPLRLDEAAELSRHFRISMDEVMQQTFQEAVVFNTSGLGNQQLDFEAYLQTLLEIFTQIQQQGVTQGFYAAKDIPVFHLFQFPDLAMFKMYFWRKTMYRDPEMSKRYFELDIQDEQEARCLDLCRQIAEKYSLIPTNEIWTLETASSFVKQISYYYESGMFRSKKDAIHVCEQVEQLFEHLKHEAEMGYKFMHGHPPNHRVENFRLYFNDLVLIDNTISIEYENHLQTFLSYNSLDYLHTTNENFSHQIQEWLKTLTKKSDLISTVSERLRNKFFLQIGDKIDVLKEKLN